MLRLITLSFISALLVSCGGPKNELIVPRPLSSDIGNAKEKEMLSLIRGHPRQKRKEMITDPRLSAAARAKARDMGKRGYFGHEDPEGTGANYSVAATGYKLPITYMAFKSSNQLESLAAGNATAKATLAQWIESWTHESQVLALAPYFREQTRCGVGYANVPGSPHIHYWVFIAAPPSRE